MRNLDEDLFNEAYAHEKKMNFTQAIKGYQKILDNNPEHFESWLNLGAIFSRQGNNQSAIKCYEFALKCKKDYRAYYNLGLEYYKSKNHKMASENLKHCCSINPFFNQGYILSGYTFCEIGDTKESINILKLGIQKCGVNESLLICLALTYFSDKDLKECTKILHQIFQLNPENRMALKLKGMLSLNEKVTRESVEVFRKLIHNDPEMAEVESFINEPKNKKTLGHINNIKSGIIEKKIKTPEDYVNLSIVSFFLGNGNAAMNYLLYALKEK